MNRNNKLFFLATAFLIGLPIMALQARAQYIGNASPVGVPLFHLRDGNTHCAGKAFAIQWFRNRKLLLMPLHLLGPGADYHEYILPQNVPDQVTSVDVLDLACKGVITTAAPGLLRTGVPVEKARGNLSEDLMAFELPANCKLPLLALAPTLVPVGTKVWVLSKNSPASSLEPDRFSGTVVRSFTTGVTVEMDRTLTALSSSGAPIVNSKNELVAMMVGKQDLRRTVVMGIPSICIYAKLYRELGR
jgi:hypothetical protein